MGMLDYLQENWRDIYRPFQRYPEIYGEHAKQGMGMLREDAPGAWDVATKPLGALMMSGIPSLYEAFRDEPIRNTLISDLGIDPQKADYATQAIGLGMDVGVPYAVIRKGLTPWISEQVAKQANPTGFSPSRRRFLKGTGAAAVGTATGVPLSGSKKQALKVAAKAVPAFAGLLAVMTKSVSKVGLGHSIMSDLRRWRDSHGKVASHLDGLTKHMDSEVVSKVDEDWLRETDKVYPSRTQEVVAAQDEILGRVPSDRSNEFEVRSMGYKRGLEGYGPLPAKGPRFGDINVSLNRVGRSQRLYEADPKGYIKALEARIKELKGNLTRVDDFTGRVRLDTETVSGLEQLLKELKAQ